VSNPRRRSVIAVGVVALLVMLYLLFVARNYTATLSYYRVVDARTITVGAVGAPRAWTRVTDVSETSSEVRITVQVFDWLSGGEAYAPIVELMVRLAQPLDGRVVKDAEGQPVPLPRCTSNVCSPVP
jgi:hypothetical protein